MDPRKVEQRYRHRACAFSAVLCAVLAAMTLGNIVGIWVGPPSIQHSVLADQWQQGMPDVALCTYDDFPARWAYVSVGVTMQTDENGTVSAGADRGFVNARSSSNLVDIDAYVVSSFGTEGRSNGTHYGSCLRVDLSVLRPRFTEAIDPRPMVVVRASFELPGLKKRDGRWKTMALLAFVPTATYTRETLGYLEPWAINSAWGEVQLYEIGMLVTSRPSVLPWYPSRMTRRYTAKSRNVIATNGIGLYPGDSDWRKSPTKSTKASAELEADERFVSRVENTSSDRLSVVYFLLGPSCAEVEYMEYTSYWWRITIELGKLGGSITLITCFWNVLLPRKFPRSDVAATYELRTWFLEGVHGQHTGMVDADAEGFLESPLSASAMEPLGFGCGGPGDPSEAGSSGASTSE